MNRHERRKAGKGASCKKRPDFLRVIESHQTRAPSTIPDDLKADIARSVRSIAFRGCDGGTCFIRATIGMLLLRDLGIPAQIALGGMVYRAGPDPCRDVLAYCGPGNLGQILPGKGWLGHYWVQSGHDVVDFSVGDWRREATPDMLLDLGQTMRDDLGPIQWAFEPPDFLWVSEAHVAPIAGQYTPEIGKAYYTGWRGPTPPVEDSLRELKTALDWQAITRHFEACCEQHALKERVWAAQNGHTAVRLSRLRYLVGLAPPRDEQCLVLRGEVEITSETAAKILSELDGDTFTERRA